jgi:hypothetical protein
VVATEGARELLVDAWFPPGALSELYVRRGAETFVRDLESFGSHGWEPVSRDPRAGVWRAPSCTTHGCRLRYRFLLREAADTIGNADTATAYGETLEAPPSSWLVHPIFASRGQRYRLHVRLPKDVRFVSGIFRPLSGDPNTYEAEAVHLPIAPYSAFGKLRAETLNLAPNVLVDLAVAPGALKVDEDAIRAWVTRTAESVAQYFGCFPVERVLVLVVPMPGEGVLRGITLGDGGASIIVHVGHETEERALQNDWILPHEMVHLGFPSVARQHHWMEEGVAVYVQPLVRQRSGEISAEAVWRELATGLPKGLPDEHDRGLDYTESHGRTYWGGALFCLIADLEIRKRTQNRYGFDDALRGILAAGGNIAVEWDLEHALEAGDRAVGVPVLRELHAAMGHAAHRVDLEKLLRRLGVQVRGDQVVFDDDAPLAAYRRAITPRAPEAPSTEGSPPILACPRPAQPAVSWLVRR